MKFFKYWAREELDSPELEFPVTGYGYSNESIDDALKKAAVRAAETASALKTRRDLHKHAYYGDRPIREEVVEAFEFDDQQIAVLTRNSYGCLVLNAANVFIADVDMPEKKPGLFASWFGKKEPDFEEQLIAKLRSLVAEKGGLGFRLYRTFNGFRVLATSLEFHPASSASKQLLEALGSDPMYVKLCQSQECYRARLSPKPWRIGLSQPNQRYPFADPEQERNYRQWLVDYERQSAGYATCAFIGEFGSAQISPIAKQVVQLHDHYALSGDKPIA